MMRLKLEVEEKKQAMVLLQRALVRASAITPGALAGTRPASPTLETLSPCQPVVSRAWCMADICPYSLQAQQRDLTIRRVREAEKELSRQLRLQKEHYEATIQRHLSFIDQVTRQWETVGYADGLQPQGCCHHASIRAQC